MRQKFKLFLIGIFCLSLLTACGQEQSAAVTPVNPVNLPATTVAATTASVTTVAATTVPATTAVPTTAALTTAAPTTIAATTAVPTTAPVRATTTAVPTTAPVRATTAAATTTTRAAQGDAQAIRKTDWLKVIKAEPKLEKTEEIFPTGKPELYVSTKDGSKVGGFPVLEPIVYVDMDGDGLEDAAISLYSGGTAGVVGFLAFRQTANGPVFVAADSGYKLFLTVENGKLLARNALYAFWEANCCPGGFSNTTYIIKNGALVKTDETTEGNPAARAGTVEQFYQLLSARSFKEAYSLLAPSFQAANPYDKWVAGYANTTKLDAQVTDDSAGPIKIVLTATDNVNGKTVTKKYNGTWKLIWDGKFPGWRLSEPSISEAK